MDKGFAIRSRWMTHALLELRGRIYVRAGRSSSPPRMSASADAGPVRAVLAERRRLLIP